VSSDFPLAPPIFVMIFARDLAVDKAPSPARVEMDDDVAIIGKCNETHPGVYEPINKPVASSTIVNLFELNIVFILLRA